MSSAPPGADAGARGDLEPVVGVRDRDDGQARAVTDRGGQLLRPAERVALALERPGWAGRPRPARRRRLRSGPPRRVQRERQADDHGRRRVASAVRQATRAPALRPPTTSDSPAPGAGPGAAPARRGRRSTPRPAASGAGRDLLARDPPRLLDQHRRRPRRAAAHGRAPRGRAPGSRRRRRAPGRAWSPGPAAGAVRSPRARARATPPGRHVVRLALADGCVTSLPGTRRPYPGSEQPVDALDDVLRRERLAAARDRCCARLLTAVETGYASSRPGAAGTSSPVSRSASSTVGSSQAAQRSRSTSSGIRSWMRPRSSSAWVVRTAQVTSHASRVVLGRVRLAPELVDPGHREHAAVLRVDEERLLGDLAGAVGGRAGALGGVPLVVAVGRQQAASPGERPPEGRLLGDRLHPGVDQPRADGRVLRPATARAPSAAPAAGAPAAAGSGSSFTGRVRTA